MISSADVDLKGSAAPRAFRTGDLFLDMQLFFLQSFDQGFITGGMDLLVVNFLLEFGVLVFQGFKVRSLHSLISRLLILENNRPSILTAES